jgi:hypothetical protein
LAERSNSLIQGWIHSLPLILALDLVAAIGGAFLVQHETFGVADGLWLATTLVVISMVTFFGFFARTEDMRSTIAATFVIVYLTLLSHFINASGLRAAVESEVGGSLLDTFTTMVTTIVAFYLGAEAAIRGTEIVQRQKTARQELAAGSTRDS